MSKMSSPLMRQLVYWSDIENKQESNSNDKLVNNIIKKISDLYQINLVELKILEKLTNYYYWFFCKKTGDIYNLNLNNENNKNHNFNLPETILSEFGKHNYTQINYVLDDNFNINKISFLNQKVISIGKPSRQLRLERRNLFNKKRDRNIYEDNSDDSEELSIPSKEQQISEEKLNKKLKIEKTDIWNEMVSASAVRNYLLKDPLLDYLNEYNIYSLEDKPSVVPNSLALKDSNAIIDTTNTSDSFTKSIMDAGIEFENELIKIIKKDHPVVKVAEYYQAKLKEKYIETINEMKKGTKVIYQGVLHNYSNKTFGMPDLIVRSDYINTLLGYPVVSDDEANLPSPNIKKPFHYKIIDIKHSNIPLRADSIHILNSDSIPAYKGQIYIYTCALNQILGINIKKAYIWGKKYFWTTKGDYYERIDFLRRLGTIDYDSVDSEFVSQTNDAIDWIRSMRKEGSKWNLLPVPTRPELYPNMKNEKDGKFHKLKSDLNEKISEITSVAYCGVTQRKEAHSNGIYSWKNPRCNAQVMGFNINGKQGKLVDSILFINRQEREKVLPKFIKWDRDNWKNVESNILEFYFDFETTNSNFGSIIKDGIIKYDVNQHIFMIGVGWVINNEWFYKCFIMKEKTDEAELLMFKSFHEFINEILKENSKTRAKFYHWSRAEILAYKRFKSKQLNYSFDDSKYEFYDLYKIFISEPITVKGALNYSLKTIAKSLFGHGLIKSNWNSSSPCSNGLNAMILANKVYDNVKDDLIDDIEKDPVMRDIQNYNQIDCKVLWEILNLLRTL